MYTEKSNHSIIHNSNWKKYEYKDKKQSFYGNEENCSLFMRDLPADFLLEECLTLLQQIGRVYKISLVIESCVFDCPNGYASVTFYDPFDAEKASEKLNNYKVREGLKIKVFLNRRQRKIIVHKVPENMTDKELLDTFSESFDELKSVESLKYKRKCYPFDKENMGFAILEFANNGAASKAMRLITQKYKTFWDNYLSANWIEPGKLHRHVIISGISPTVSDIRLLNLLNQTSNHGVVNFKWFHETLYVDFMTNLHAEIAFENLSGYELDGEKIQIIWNVFPDA